MCCVLGWGGGGSKPRFRISITLSSPFVSGNNENTEIQAHSDNLDRMCNDKAEDTTKEKTDSKWMGLLQQVHGRPALVSLHARSRLHTDGHFLRPVNLFPLTIPIQGKKHEPKIQGLKWTGRKQWDSINIPFPLWAYLAHQLWLKQSFCEDFHIYHFKKLSFPDFKTENECQDNIQNFSAKRKKKGGGKKINKTQNSKNILEQSRTMIEGQENNLMEVSKY